MNEVKVMTVPFVSVLTEEHFSHHVTGAILSKLVLETNLFVFMAENSVHENKVSCCRIQINQVFVNTV